MADEWISKFHPEYLAGFMAFRIKDLDLFPKIMFSEQILNLYKQQPAKWWSVMENRTVKANNLPSGFCNFFANLLTCPSSSASIERLFSIFGLVWTKLRNRLGIEKATKLVKIHRCLNLTNLAA